jgi:hypothetical protein
MDTKKTVFFTCSTTDFATRRKQYARIIEALRSMGIKVISNISLEEFEANKPKEDYSHYSNSSSYFATIKKIVQSDAVIVDASVYSMTMGNIVSYALSMKKHCLLLTEEIEDDPQDLFIAGNESPLLQYKIYTQENLEKIVRDFVKNKPQAGNVRLNFVLDKDVSNRLDWLSFRTKLSKTEIVRRAINSYDPDIDN